RARNIQRYAQRYATEGGESFFAPHSRKGTAFRFTAELQEQANELLAQGASNYRVAKEVGVSEGTVRYHLKKGTLIRPDFKKSFVGNKAGSVPRERNHQDVFVSDSLGVAAGWITERI